MRLQAKLAIGVCAAAVAMLPATAQAGGPKYETPHGPPQGKQPHGKAYGYWCRGESKKHVKGEQGTAFSRCVKAMARAARNDDLSPGQACKGLSKKHVKGEKGTAFSRCVRDVAKMRRHQPAVRYESGPMEFGPNGWGGWSCPTGTSVINGGYEPSTATVAYSAPARPGETNGEYTYPVYPHWTFAEGETGWVVQNGPEAQSLNVYVICK
jgi:hypothetical protein